MVRSEDLTEAQRAALDAIVAGGDDPKQALAWTEAVRLVAAGHEPSVLTELVRLELAVEWVLVGVLQYTLTPYGAWLMRVQILERLSIRGDEIEEDPYWAELDRDAPPLHLPKRRHEIRWPWMDEAEDPNWVDPSDSPEFMLDAESGKTIELFTRLNDGREVSGFKVLVDKRLKGAKRRQLKEKAKRRKAG